jgi:hypothetical protein
MGGCAIIDCKNRVSTVSNGKHFYRFPKDREIRKFWRVFTKRGTDWKVKDSSVICEDHFEPKCFIKKQKRMFLKKDAIPTIYQKETSAGVEKLMLSDDGDYDNYCLLVKQEEDKEEEAELLNDLKKTSRLEEIKTLCRFCSLEKDVVIEIKNFETYNIDTSTLFNMLELNTDPECNAHLSDLVCEECFNQVVLLDTFKTKCKMSESRILAELDVLVPELKLPPNIQSYPILEIVGSVKDEAIDIQDPTVYEVVAESSQDFQDSQEEPMDTYENSSEVIKNPKRNKFVLKVFECLFCKQVGFSGSIINSLILQSDFFHYRNSVERRRSNLTLANSRKLNVKSVTRFLSARKDTSPIKPILMGKTNWKSTIVQFVNL